MWARVKGKTENALARLPFKASYMVRPGVIQPRHGIRSKTRLYRVVYAVVAPVVPAAALDVPELDHRHRQDVAGHVARRPHRARRARCWRTPT